jgi:hypothetical protein
VADAHRRQDGLVDRPDGVSNETLSVVPVRLVHALHRSLIGLGIPRAHESHYSQYSFGGGHQTKMRANNVGDLQPDLALCDCCIFGDISA